MRRKFALQLPSPSAALPDLLHVTDVVGSVAADVVTIDGVNYAKLSDGLLQIYDLQYSPEKSLRVVRFNGLCYVIVPPSSQASSSASSSVGESSQIVPYEALARRILSTFLF